MRRLRVAMQSEYKPDTQDGRFSPGTRSTEILVQRWDHLAKDLGPEEQLWVHLMNNGFDPEDDSAIGKSIRTYLQKDLGLDLSDEEVIKNLQEMFWGWDPVGHVTQMTKTGLSTSDILEHEHHHNLKKDAEAARDILMAAGMSIGNIIANINDKDEDMEAWFAGIPTDVEEWAAIRAQIGGRITALQIQIKGPETNSEIGFQKKDMVSFQIPHTDDVLKWAKHPEKLISTMAVGQDERWDGSLFIVPDGGVARQRRAFEMHDVQLLHRAGKHIQVEAGVWRNDLRGSY